MLHAASPGMASAESLAWTLGSGAWEFEALWAGIVMMPEVEATVADGQTI
jgi:hypothetical protein